MNIYKNIKYYTICVLLHSVFLSPGVADIRIKKTGTEFDLIEKQIGDQLEIDLSIKFGSGIVVWHDNSTDSDGLGISGQRIDVLGNSLGSTFKVNTTIIGNQEKPKVDINLNNSIYYIWEGGESGFRRVQYRISNAKGQFISNDKYINNEISGEQTDPNVAALSNGDAAIVWTDYNIDGDHKDICAIILNEYGEKVTDVINLNDFKIGNQYNPQIQSYGNGKFIVVWSSDQQQTSKSIDVIARIFSNKGNALSDEIIINKLGICANPEISVNEESIFVAWEQLDILDKKNKWDIGFKVFDKEFNPLSDSALINLKMKGDQYSPKIQANSQGAMVVWNSLGQDNSREAVVSRFVYNNGILGESEIIVNSKSAHSQLNPVLSTTRDNGFIVSWSTPNIGSNGFDIAAQSFVIDDGNYQDLKPMEQLHVNPVSETEIITSWPKVSHSKVKHYEIFFEANPVPKIFTDNLVIWPNLKPGTEYAFRIRYETVDGKKSILSEFFSNKTWGRDFNKDGLPDDWQKVNFGDSKILWPDISEDSDGDGATNEDEFLASTNPNDPNSVLSISYKVLERGARIEWNAKVGAIYQLQTKNNLQDNWKDTGPVIFAGDKVVGITIELNENKSFFRVVKKY